MGIFTQKYKPMAIKSFFVLGFYKYLLIILCLFLTVTVKGQGTDFFRIAFYNVENFFDTDYDSSRVYNEFTPDGEQHWDFYRYRKKRTNLFKTLLAAGQGKPLSLVGFCEVENDKVIRDLILSTPLKTYDYQYVNYPSPDRRGIDVGLIYLRSEMRLISSKPIALRDPGNDEFRSRDILYASFLIGTDTLHVFVNHWPSRWGGELPTRRLRMLAAQTLRQQVDSLMRNQSDPKIIIMGDFNDTPFDESLSIGLRAVAEADVSDSSQLVNLFTDTELLGFEGTLKHQYDWQIFDMIIISQSLKGRSGLSVIEGSQRIFAPDFLFTDDERYMGKKLFRTYLGPRYEGGFSDHLPVYVDIQLNEPNEPEN